MEISITYAKMDLSRLIRLVVRGKEVIITRRGVPVARLVWIAASPKNRARVPKS
jgi:prevent-host-death family protein